jgi:hypothetical protein
MASAEADQRGAVGRVVVTISGQDVELDLATLAAR